MHPFIKTILYGLGVFVIFITLAVALKMITRHVDDENAYFGLLTKNDLLIGVVVAVFVSFSHERRKKLK